MTTEPKSGGDCYEVRLQGHLDPHWADRLQGLSFAPESDGTTTLTGQLADQSALHGLLSQLRDLGVPIISIRRIGDNGDRTVAMTTNQDMEELQ